MHIKIPNGEQTNGSRTVIHLSILLVVAFFVGIYLVVTAVLIAQDGATFIKYAKKLEVSPIEVIKSERQHPGYPFLIIFAHKTAQIWEEGSSLQSWIYSAQAMTLLFRLLAIASLYFVGKQIVGERFSFWAILILILLPDAAKLGSDALSDWPHIFFLSTGFLLLIQGASSGKFWLFGLSGLVAGMGYLIRPECVQVIVLGVMWLGLQLFYSKRIISRRKAVFAFILLLIGFLAVAGPYMQLKGGLFPKKHLVEFLPDEQSPEVYEQGTKLRSNIVSASNFAPSDIAEAWGKLEQRIGETLMWVFVPALLIGMYIHLRKRNWSDPEGFFIIALIALNILIMTLLYCKYSYMSRRHTLPLVIFTIFYVPPGLKALASWLDKKLSKTVERFFAIKANTDFWFVVLLVTGISICSPKLLRPIRIEKQSYRDAASWLIENTDEKDIIAVSDVRIAFYSGRRNVRFDGRVIPEAAQYAVQIFEDKQDMPTSKEMLQVKKVFSAEDEGRKFKAIIYKQEH